MISESQGLLVVRSVNCVRTRGRYKVDGVIVHEAESKKRRNKKGVSHPQDFSLVAYEPFPIGAKRRLHCHRGIGSSSASPPVAVVVSSDFLVFDHSEGAGRQLLHKDQAYGFARYEIHCVGIS